MIRYYFVEPADSLFMRGNQAFGQSGQHGGGTMPPSPAVLAGALRSAMLARDPALLTRFIAAGRSGDPALDQCIGTLDPSTGDVIDAGTFGIEWLTLALAKGASAAPEPLHVLPADLLSMRVDAPLGDADGTLVRVQPRLTHSLLQSSAPLPMQPVPFAASAGKSTSGYLLRDDGWRRYLAGEVLSANRDSIATEQIYRADPRLGIGISETTHAAASGLIYTTDGFAFNSPSAERDTTGFLVGVSGAPMLPEMGVLRLGGDGRSARYRLVDFEPAAVAPTEIERDKRFRIVLTTPALFANGWHPDAVSADGEELWLSGCGFSAKLVCACVPREQVVSGWNLFQNRPKPAERCVPAGAVYWFDQFCGDAGKLAKWVNSGLAGDTFPAGRRAEGFNRAQLACWPRDVA